MTTTTEIRCAGCGGEVDRLTNAANPYCSKCQPTAEERHRELEWAEAKAMERIADCMHEEAGRIEAIDATTDIAQDLRGWAARLSMAATIRRLGRREVH